MSKLRKSQNCKALLNVQEAKFRAIIADEKKDLGVLLQYVVEILNCFGLLASAEYAEKIAEDPEACLKEEEKRNKLTIVHEK